MPLELRRRGDRVFRVVAHEYRVDHQIRVERARDFAIKEQLLNRTVALHAGVDDAVVHARTAGTGRLGLLGLIEAILEEMAERLPCVHLHGEHERIAEDDDPPFAGRLRTDLAIVADTLAVDRDRGVEFGGDEPGARVRTKPVADHRIGHEKRLKRRRGLGVAPDPQCGLEHRELHGGDRDGEQRATPPHHEAAAEAWSAAATSSTAGGAMPGWSGRHST